MAVIDVALPPEIQRQLELPICADIRIPKPKIPQITLPTGGTIKGIADLTKGVPSDCSLNMSLALQLAPVMASIECLLKVLGLIKPLTSIMEKIKDGNIPGAGLEVPAFLEAAAKLSTCILAPTPLILIPFIRDVLALILAILRCVIQQLRSAIALLSGLELKIATARSTGNTALLSSLECCKENGKTALASAAMGVEPVGVLLELLDPFMGLAGVDPIKLPAVGNADDLASAEQTLADLQAAIETIQKVVDTL